MAGIIAFCTVPSTRSGVWSSKLRLGRLGVANCRRYQKRCLLVRAEVNFVSADEAKRLVDEEGYAILDVRDKTQFERAHIKTCYHVPLFVENNDNDLGTIVKRTVHNNFSGLFFGLSFTKPNPEFVQSVKKQFSADSKILLVCQEGLRSAAAANKLDAEGFENIACITSGLQTVNPGTFDSVGSTELQNAGKAGLVTVQGKISAVLGLFFGLSFTKPNPEFVQSVKKQFSADSKILLVCQEGLRSAAAANKLDAEGFENIACITSGLQTVSPGTFDSVGSTELQNAGKAGLVTVQGKISAVLGTILICAYLFITLFPDQAEKILQLIPAN